MDDANLFQLGIGPETGAHAEDPTAPANRRADAGAAAGLAPASSHRDPFDPLRADHFVRRDGRVYAGTHLIIEVAEGSGLDDADRIETAFREIIAAAGATLLHIHLHKFTPQGISGVAVLAESHISVHTWPEIGYGAFDVFMCGDARPEAAIPVLKRVFATDRVDVKTLHRGEEIVTAALAARAADSAREDRRHVA